LNLTLTRHCLFLLPLCARGHFPPSCGFSDGLFFSAQAGQSFFPFNQIRSNPLVCQTMHRPFPFFDDLSSFLKRDLSGTRGTLFLRGREGPPKDFYREKNRPGPLSKSSPFLKGLFLSGRRKAFPVETPIRKHFLGFVSGQDSFSLWAGCTGSFPPLWTRESGPRSGRSGVLF